MPDFEPSEAAAARTFCYQCPVEAALDVIGGRWKAVIVCQLLEGTLRFGQLRKKVPGVSERMLTHQLKELEADGVVHREVYREVPPRVEYSVTAFGETLRPVMRIVGTWGQEHLARLESGAGRRRRGRLSRD